VLLGAGCGAGAPPLWDGVLGAGAGAVVPPPRDGAGVGSAPPLRAVPPPVLVLPLSVLTLPPPGPGPVPPRLPARPGEVASEDPPRSPGRPGPPSPAAPRADDPVMGIAAADATGDVPWPGPVRGSCSTRIDTVEKS
jgi:hypothetical protein